MNKNKHFSAQQNEQSRQYIFPYHYITNKQKKRWWATRAWGFAYSYAAALHIFWDHLRSECERLAKGFNHLDIGCGDGALTYHTNSELGRSLGISIDGLDYDSRAIAWARIFNQEAEFHDIPLNELGSLYHSVSLIEVIEHIPPDDLPEFILEAAKIHRSGGPIFVTVPSKTIPVSKKHFQHFDGPLLRKYFDEYYDIECVSYFEKHTFLSKIFYHLCFNKFWRLDLPFINEFLINQYSKTKSKMEGSGRVLLIGRRK